MDAWTLVKDAFGLDREPKDLTFVNVTVRSVFVYVAGLAVVRVVKSRFMGKNTVFDVVLGIIFGATISRAINGSGPVFMSIVAGAVLVLLHELFALAAARWRWFSVLTEGRPETLAREGVTDWKSVRKNRLSRTDYEEALRTAGNVDDPEKVALATMERNGAVSVVPRQGAHVVDVKVQDGVQTVRIVVDS